MVDMSFSLFRSARASALGPLRVADDLAAGVRVFLSIGPVTKEGVRFGGTICAARKSLSFKGFSPAPNDGASPSLAQEVPSKTVPTFTPCDKF